MADLLESLGRCGSTQGRAHLAAMEQFLADFPEHRGRVSEAFWHVVNIQGKAVGDPAFDNAMAAYLEPPRPTYKAELTPTGEQYVIPGVREEPQPPDAPA